MDNLCYHILNKINEGIIVIDSEQRVVIWNSWLERCTKKTKSEVINKKIGEVCPRFQEPIFQDILNKALRHGQGRFCSGTLHHSFIPYKTDGQNENLNRQNMLVEPVWLENKKFALIQVTDITGHYRRVNKLKSFIKQMEVEFDGIKQAEKVNRKLALYDPLTGLPNRNLFLDRFVWTIDYAHRNQGKFFTMFMDLDGFKEVNDTYGHEVGDTVLKAVAQRLEGLLRKTDTVARYGGDEFTLLLTQVERPEGASHIAEKIIDRFKAPFEVNGITMNIGISIGISTYPKDGLDPSILIRKADVAMYEVKKIGKNSFKHFDL